MTIICDGKDDAKCKGCELVMLPTHFWRRGVYVNEDLVGMMLFYVCVFAYVCIYLYKYMYTSTSSYVCV